MNSQISIEHKDYTCDMQCIVWLSERDKWVIKNNELFTLCVNPINSNGCSSADNGVLAYVDDGGLDSVSFFELFSLHRWIFRSLYVRKCCNTNSISCAVRPNFFRYWTASSLFLITLNACLIFCSNSGDQRFFRIVELR